MNHFDLQNFKANNSQGNCTLKKNKDKVISCYLKNKFYSHFYSYIIFHRLSYNKYILKLKYYKMIAGAQ